MIPKLRETINIFVDRQNPFSISDIKKTLESSYKESDEYFDRVTFNEIKRATLALFERGEILGYCLKSKPMVGDRGPYFKIEFVPEDQALNLDLILAPTVPKKTSCNLSPKDKKKLKKIAKQLGCSQDMLIRSLLIRGLKDF